MVDHALVRSIVFRYCNKQVNETQQQILVLAVYSFWIRTHEAFYLAALVLIQKQRLFVLEWWKYWHLLRNFTAM